MKNLKTRTAIGTKLCSEGDTSMAQTELTVEQIEAAIEAESAVKAKLEEDLARDIEAQSKNEMLRGKISYAALTKEHNPRGKRKLVETESTAARLAQRIISTQRAIEVSNSKVALLRQQRSEAQRREQLARYAKGKADLMAAASDFEMKLCAFIEQKEKITAQFEELNRLSFGLHETDSRPHRNLPRAFRWSLEQRLGIDSPYRDKDFRARFRAPLPEIFNRILGGELTTDETASKADGVVPGDDDRAVESDTEQDKQASGE
jgi:hypothetical protein